MTREELFLAIGGVEESRLARSELRVSSKKMSSGKSGGKSKRVFRNFLIAAIIISMLAVSAYAVTCYLIFDSPQALIAAIFGDETGYDHSDGGEKYFDDGSLAAIEPTFDRIPADEAVVAEDIAPYVDIVGQSISFQSYTLTVDAFAYDSATRCGFVTYLLENPNGLPEYKLQSNGQIWYDGVPDIVHINPDGYPYIIQEKTTATCLAVAYYFQWTESWGQELEITLESQQRYTPAEFETMITEELEKLKREMYPEEALETVRQQLGEEKFEIAMGDASEEERIEQCYTHIAASRKAEALEAEGTSEAIRVPLAEDRQLEHVAAGDGSVLLSPISIRIDISQLDFLHTDRSGKYRVHTDNIDSVVLQYEDGSQYPVMDDYVVNYMLASAVLPDENVQTEIYVSPEEDPEGEGYVSVENSHDYCILTMIFNRIVDIDAVASVILNGTELKVN